MKYKLFAKSEFAPQRAWAVIATAEDEGLILDEFMSPRVDLTDRSLLKIVHNKRTIAFGALIDGEIRKAPRLENVLTRETGFDGVRLKHGIEYEWDLFYSILVRDHTPNWPVAAVGLGGTHLPIHDHTVVRLRRVVLECFRTLSKHLDPEDRGEIISKIEKPGPYYRILRSIVDFNQLKGHRRVHERAVRIVHDIWVQDKSKKLIKIVTSNLSLTDVIEHVSTP